MKNFENEIKLLSMIYRFPRARTSGERHQEVDGELQKNATV